MSIDLDTFKNLVLVGVCCVMAYIVVRKISPYLWGRREGENALQHIERALQEEQQRNEQQYLLNASTKAEANKIHIVNVGLLIGVLFVATRFRLLELPMYAFLYAVAGLIVNRLLRVIPAERFAGLSFGNRIYLRLYYAWQWPRYVALALMRKRG